MKYIEIKNAIILYTDFSMMTSFCCWWAVEMVLITYCVFTRGTTSIVFHIF